MELLRKHTREFFPELYPNEVAFYRFFDTINFVEQVKGGYKFKFYTLLFA